MSKHHVLVTGGTGYIGTGLIPELLAQLLPLTRELSRHKLPAGCTAVAGDALNGDSYCRFPNTDENFASR